MTTQITQIFALICESYIHLREVLRKLAKKITILFEFPISDSSLKYVTIRDSSQLWLPRTVFSNENEGDEFDLINPETIIRLHRNGTVLFSQR